MNKHLPLSMFVSIIVLFVAAALFVYFLYLRSDNREEVTRIDDVTALDEVGNGEIIRLNLSIPLDDGRETFDLPEYFSGKIITVLSSKEYDEISPSELLPASDATFTYRGHIYGIANGAFFSVEHRRWWPANKTRFQRELAKRKINFISNKDAMEIFLLAIGHAEK